MKLYEVVTISTRRKKRYWIVLYCKIFIFVSR